MSKLKKNLGFQTIYQLLATAIPLITSPYLSRVLGAAGLGVYSYTYSVVNYFMLFAMLGLTNYGTRSIAMARTQKEEHTIFCEVYTLQLISSLIACFGYLVVILCSVGENRTIFVIQSLWLVSCFLDVNWYFFGKEEFKTTVTRNLAIKLLTVVSIFVFVHSPNDLWKYTLIMAGGTFISQFVLVFVLRRRTKFKVSKPKDVVKHIRPNILLFIPIIAMSVFHLMDKTMLGIISTAEQSGYYYNADKVVNIPLGIISGVGTVMLPKVSSMRSEGKTDEIRSLLCISVDIFVWLACAMACGIAAISNEFVPVFFGAGYDACISLSIVLAGVMIFKTLSNVIRTQYLIPFNREKVYIGAVVAGAVINFIINFTLIYVCQMGAMGAVIGTIVAEGCVSFFQCAASEQALHLRMTYLKVVPYIIAGVLMYVVVRIVASAALFASLNGFVQLFLEIMIGAAIYIILSLIYWVVSKNKILNAIKRKKR